LLGDAFEEAGAEAGAGAVAPVGRFVDGRGDFDQPPGVGVVLGAGELGVLAEGVEAGH